MAQDFKGFFGLGNGREINPVDANGVNMAATQALARKVRHLESRVKSPTKFRGFFGVDDDRRMAA
jgi:hypothetical protein